MDAKKSSVDRHYESDGQITTTEETMVGHGQHQPGEVVVERFRLVNTSHKMHKRKSLVVMVYCLMPVPQREVTVRSQWLVGVLTPMRGRAIRRFLTEHGLLDEEPLGCWKPLITGVLMQVMHNMAVLAYIQGLARLPWSWAACGPSAWEARRATGS